MNDFADAFAEIATEISGEFGAPYFAAQVILAPASPGGYNDDGVWVPGSPAQTADCLVQIDAMNEAWRAQAGFADGTYRFIILAASFDGSPNADSSVMVDDASAPAWMRGTWAVSALTMDPVGIGWVGKGRQS